ncbi:MAG: hypothetical protein K2X82_12150 [Gemmataceae bacterium]|nr:hypothetical protein [Gemmataceae bacterium]
MRRMLGAAVLVGAVGAVTWIGGPAGRAAPRGLLDRTYGGDPTPAPTVWCVNPTTICPNESGCTASPAGLSCNQCEVETYRSCVKSPNLDDAEKSCTEHWPTQGQDAWCGTKWYSEREKLSDNCDCEWDIGTCGKAIPTSVSFPKGGTLAFNTCAPVK